jgi:hypothetical protein
MQRTPLRGDEGERAEDNRQAAGDDVDGEQQVHGRYVFT